MLRYIKFCLPVIMVLLIFFLTVASHAKVIIETEENEIQYWSTADTVEDILKELNIKVDKYDEILPDLTTDLTKVKHIKIKKAAKVALTLEGKTEEYVTTAENVDDFLKENNVILSKMDIVQPDPTTVIKDDVVIEVVEVKEEVIEEKEDIPFSIENRKD